MGKSIDDRLEGLDILLSKVSSLKSAKTQYLADLIRVEHDTIKGHTHVGFRHFEERKPVPVTTEERIAETDAGNQQHLEEDLNGKLHGVIEKASYLAIDVDPLDKISVEQDFDCKRTKSITGKTNSIIVEDTEETMRKH